jgi:dTDP-glucose pyrophosphorylase
MLNRHEKDIAKYLLLDNVSLKKAIGQMNETGEKVLFVIDAAGALIGALSDGDIRKGILKEGGMAVSVAEVFNMKPIYVHENCELSHVKKIMLDLKITNVPVVNTEHQIVDVLNWDQVFRNGIERPQSKIDIPVVIMAGGKGKRLAPFTHVLPKPMIPIGDKTIIEIIMDKFHEYGVKRFFLSVNHMAPLIKAYLLDMVSHYAINYIEEEKPLGTAGSLRLLLGCPEKQFFVTNCDIIIESDLADMVAYHNEEAFDMTIIVSQMHYEIPYGICEIVNGGHLAGITEKPIYNLLVNTGMYIVNRSVLELIPENKKLDIPDLISVAQENQLRVGVFPVDEKSWIDVGQWEEYHKAVNKLLYH